MIANRQITAVGPAPGIGYMPPRNPNVPWGMGSVGLGLDPAVVPTYSGYGGHDPEEQAKIDATVAAQYAAWQTGQQAQLAGQWAASAEADKLAAAANAAICARNDQYPCGSPVCFADANRDQIASDWSHIQVACVDKSGAKRYFPRTTTATAIAATFPAHTAAETLAEHNAVYGVPTTSTGTTPAANLEAVARANGVTVDELRQMIAAQSGQITALTAAMATRPTNTGTGGGAPSTAGGALDTSALLGTLTAPVDIAGYSVSPLLLLAGAVGAYFIFKK